jgi:hypothetical protein
MEQERTRLEEIFELIDGQFPVLIGPSKLHGASSGIEDHE